MTYAIKQTNQFKKQYKLMQKRGADMNVLHSIVKALSCGELLPPKNRDHPLGGDWAGYRECHIAPDWLLVYRMDADALVLWLMRTGTHSDLFI